MLSSTKSLFAGANSGPVARPAALAVAQRAQRTHPLVRSIPVPSSDVIGAQDSAKLEKLKQCFRMADIDGNGAIDKQELRALLESVDEGLTYLMAWEGTFPDAKLDAIFEKYDKDKNGTITFDEFQSIVYDGLLLEGTLADYERAFRAVDDSGNGSIGATELAEVFKQLGNPVSPDKLVDIFMKYDVDSSGQIEFPEFIEMFRDQLLDLAQINAWLKEREGSSLLRPGALDGGQEDLGVLETVEGTVSVLFAESELDEVLKKHANRLVVLFGGVTWCRPCKGVQKPYERMADHYDRAVFLKLYGNANVQTKRLFQRLKIRSTPAFIAFRGGEVVGQSSGANKEKLEAFLRSHMTAEELRDKEALYPPVEANA